MSERFDFADTLNRYVGRSAYTAGQLATLSGLPKSTIVNWLQGRVVHPREWQTVVRLLDVLRLDEREADRVLQAAGHPPLAELRRLADGTQRELLSAWPAAPIRSRPPVPFQAIPDPPFFVGREEVIRRLSRWLRAGERCVVQGLAGVGKTALAARLAYHLRPHFADGVLWALLSASDPAAILDTFARAYGLDLADLPDLADRSRVVRDLLADKQALIILDDATESALVAPLLPPSGRCATLITTRHQNLRVGLGARRLTLTPFSGDGGTVRRLFVRVLGEERVAAEEKQFDAIATLLGRLPLALVVIASRLAYEPGWSAGAILDRLQQEQRRLAELDYDDLSPRLSFAVGLEKLPQSRRHLFAALSTFPGDSFTPEAAAAVASTGREEADDTLRVLHSRSLVQVAHAGRYTLHPLLRDFGADLLRADGDEAVDVSRRRLVAYYRRFLQSRAGRLDASTIHDLSAEQENIAGALRLAWSLGERATYVDMLLVFVPYLIEQGFLELAAGHLQQAALAELRAAECARWLATTARRRRRYEEAERYLETAHTLLFAPQSSEKPEITAAALLIEKAIIAACRGQHSRARDLFDRAAPEVRRSGDPALLQTLLKERGAVQVALGAYEAAEADYTEALELARAFRPVRVPGVLRALGGLVVGRDRDYARAREYYLAALEEAQAYEAYPGLPTLLNNLAVTMADGGDPAGAEAALQEALELARQRGDPVPLALILLNLGRLARYGDEEEAARHFLEEALVRASAAAHAGLAAAAEAVLAGPEEAAPRALPSLTILFD